MVFGFGKGKQETKAAAPTLRASSGQAGCARCRLGDTQLDPARLDARPDAGLEADRRQGDRACSLQPRQPRDRDALGRGADRSFDLFELYYRARKCSNALLADGVQKGDRVATLAWNTQRHIETWYGTMCIGAVLHTLNPRLFPEQIAWIINHAEDTHVFYDITFQPIIEAIKDKVPSVKHWIVLTDAAHKPQSSMNLRTYEGIHRAAFD